MTKTNPLFIDSTKTHGDSIGTHVELKKILVYDDEDLLIVVTNHQGVAMRIPMKVAEDETSYEARVHLNHQKAISYQFVVEKNGQLILQSATLRSRAQYAIIEDWQPLGADTPAPVPAQDTNDGTQPWPGEYAKSVKGLIDKWGL
ncbi:MAG: hypothetical protein KF799_05750 [Bdellovibrionales bacterium]|nr:hypothetical protein [Bdellovibrionales bacterium]